MPVLDPLQLARDACGEHHAALGCLRTAKDFREGRRDGCNQMQVAERAVRAALEAAAAAVDRETEWYDRQYRETFNHSNTDAEEHSRDRIAARARATRQAAAVIRGEFEGWSGAEPSCNGSWGTCPNAHQALQADGNMRGAPIMRCRLTGKHPDECRPQAAIRPGEGEQAVGDAA